MLGSFRHSELLQYEFIYMMQVHLIAHIYFVSQFQGQVEKPESLQFSEEDDSSNSDDRSIDIQSSVPEVIESPDTSKENIEDSCPAPSNKELMPDDTVRCTSRTTKHGKLSWVKS
jgi:hypothetical protein